MSHRKRDDADGWLLFSFVCLLAFSGGHEVSGAKISRIQDVKGLPSSDIFINGEIEEGDYETFYNLVAAG
jgi:hypothetical protein